MIENAEGPPKLSAALLREAAAMIVAGHGREEVAAALGIERDALGRHVGPLTVEPSNR